MLDSLHRAISDRATDQELRVIVIRGSGPVFSAGHDLKELVRFAVRILYLALNQTNLSKCGK